MAASCSMVTSKTLRPRPASRFNNQPAAFSTRMSRLYETGDCRQHRANCPAKVSTHIFAPEAQWRLAGGGTTGTKPVESPSPERAKDRSRSAAPPGLGGLGSRSRWFHHRLISGVPPGRRVIPDLCRNLSWTVCATVAVILDLLESSTHASDLNN